MSTSYRSYILLAAIVGVALWVPVCALGQAADSVYALGEVTVTASREAVRPARASQRVSVLDREAIASTAARTVADLLSARSTLFVRQQGQGLATVSQRGGGPSQTQLLIDGMRLSDPQLGQFDLTLLPTHLFETVEILHGPGSALYGTDGMSGIIHLRARRGNDERLSVLTEAGAYGERLASAGLSFDDGSVVGLFSAEYSSSEGDFPYLNRSLFPARTVRRTNADRERRSLFATLHSRLGQHGLRGAFLYADAAQGVPALAGTVSQGERRWDEHSRLWLEDHLPVAAGALSVRAYLHKAVLRYRNEVLELDETGRTTTAGVETSFQMAAGSQVDMTVGAAGGYGSARHPSLVKGARDVHGSAFASATASYGPFRIFPAIRVDAYRQLEARQSAVSPRLGANVRLTSRGPVYLKMNAATGFRVPTFNDRFWQPGGNPDLKPERSQSFDAGLLLDKRALRVEVTGFVSRYSNEIVWTNDRAYWSPENLSRSVSEGVEASFVSRPVRWFTMGGSYAFTRAVDRSAPREPSFDRQRRYVPRHHATAYVDASVGPLRLDLNGRYIGRRYVTSDESQSLESVFVADAQAAVRRTVGPFAAQLSVVVENVLNVRYAVIQGYPMPPRHARIRLLIETN